MNALLHNTDTHPFNCSKLILLNERANLFDFTDIDECLQNPCSNSVTCQNVPGSYTCVCNAGWAGQDCDIGRLKMCTLQFMKYCLGHYFNLGVLYRGYVTKLQIKQQNKINWLW